MHEAAQGASCVESEGVMCQVSLPYITKRNTNEMIYNATTGKFIDSYCLSLTTPEMHRVSLPYTTHASGLSTFDDDRLFNTKGESVGYIIGGRRYVVMPKPKRRTLTQCIAAWLLKRFDAWLQGGAKHDWSKGKG